MPGGESGYRPPEDEAAQSSRTDSRTRSLALRVAAVVAAVAAASGVAIAHSGDDTEKNPTRITESAAEKAKPIEIDGIAKGDTVNYYPGYYKFDFSKAHARTSADVENDPDNNLDDLDGTSDVIVVNPILVDEPDGISDPNGHWIKFEAGGGRLVYVAWDAAVAAGAVTPENASHGDELSVGSVLTVQAEVTGITDAGILGRNVDDGGYPSTGSELLGTKIA